MKIDFSGLSRLSTAEGRVSELQNISLETFKTKKQIKQRLKNKNKTRTCPCVGQLQKKQQQHMPNGNPEREERKERKKYLK